MSADASRSSGRQGGQRGQREVANTSQAVLPDDLATFLSEADRQQWAREQAERGGVSSEDQVDDLVEVPTGEAAALLNEPIESDEEVKVRNRILLVIASR